MNSTTGTPAETSAAPEVLAFRPHAVEERCRTDFNFLAGISLPDVCTANFPAVYLSMFVMLTTALTATRDFSKFAIGLPRGFAKSTKMKILVVWAILFSPKRFILVVCASAELAENIVKDVCAILSSPNIIKVFGNWQDYQETNRADLKQFHFRGRTIILRGIGSNTTVRGINVDNARPDMVLCDDMQTADESESPTRSKALQKWLVGTLMKCKSPTGCTFIYVGNMYRDIPLEAHGTLHTCILRNLQHNPEWTSWIVGGILSDWTSLWEEVQPIEQLLSELANDISMGQADVFASEVLNDPKCGFGTHFDISKVPEFDIDPLLDVCSGAFLMIDPSLGKKASDQQVVVECRVYDGIPVIEHVFIQQVSAPKLVDWVLQYAIQHRIPLICSETVAYQATLLQWFEQKAEDYELSGIQFLPVSPKGRKKNSRIINYFKSLMEGKMKIHPRSLAKTLSQIQDFDPAKTTNVDDILDTEAYCEDVFLNYAEECTLSHIYTLEQGEEYEVLEDNCVF